MLVSVRSAVKRFNNPRDKTLRGLCVKHSQLCTSLSVFMSNPDWRIGQSGLRFLRFQHQNPACREGQGNRRLYVSMGTVYGNAG